MKTITRGAYVRMNDTGYRFECPEGHTSLKLLQQPEMKKRGNMDRRTVFEHHNGKEYEWMFKCMACGETYESVYDKKHDWWVTIDPPRKTKGVR